ncbi:MAG: creatininase family protein [Clostridia bacterium]|jgi:creatinine amidohydrolase
MRCEKVLYEELQPREFVERINAFPVAYLPLGTLEWHGLHLPLGSDGLQARGVFERIASEIGGIVLPMLFLGPDRAMRKDDAVYYGMDIISFDDGAPQQLEGSAYYISDQLFCDLLDTIMHNLARAGFKLVIGHGHGPSTKAFSDRKQIFQEKYGLLTYNLWELGYEGEEGIQTDHAAANEASLVMALRPELVDMDMLSADSIPIGVGGEDPRKAASAERGNELIEKNIRRISQKAKAIMSGIPKAKREISYENIKNLLR